MGKEDVEMLPKFTQDYTKKDKKKKGLRGKKKLMVEAMGVLLGNITLSAKKVGIERKTHYNWLENDELYKQAIEEMPERTLDFVENALMKNVENGNIAAQIFYLKTKGKSRGFIERQEIENIGEQFNNVKLEIIDKTEDVRKDTPDN